MQCGNKSNPAQYENAVVKANHRPSRASCRWLPVEAVCAGLGGEGSQSLAAAEGRELILFGGKVTTWRPGQLF